MEALNDTLDQLNLIGIYRIFHPKAADYTIFSSARGTFSSIDHMLGHKVSLGKFRKTEVISVIFSEHNTMRLEINYQKKKKKKGGEASLVAQTVNNLLAMQETQVPSLDQEDPLEKEMATHSSILAWEVP